MMDCKRVNKNLLHLVENELPEDERILIEDHIKICPSCSRLFKEFTHFWGGLKQREKIPPDPYFWIKLQRRIVDYEKDKSRVWGRFESIIHLVRPAIAVTAVLLCIFLGHSLGNIPQTANGQTTTSETVRLTALQNFFENHYFSPLSDLPAGSIEATYWKMMSQE
jgi:predicted anti-sigma-YlaC factor YlaD